MTGNDGGVSITTDRGATWRHVRNLPIAQFYHGRVDNDLPYHIYGGLQDNGSWRGPSATWENGGIRNSHWLEVAFGDGFDTIPDPDNSRRGYAMAQEGYLSRWDLDTGEGRSIKPPPPNPETPLRFNWNAGFAQDPFDSATIYYGSQFVHRSNDRGNSWRIISPDLTSNNPEWQKQRESGGLTPDVTGAENYTSIITIAPSKLERGVLWVSSDDGHIHVTRDGGGRWERIDGKARGVPENSWVPSILPSPHAEGTAFVVFDNHRRSDFNTYIYRVENYGARWTRLDTKGVNGYALALLQDPEDPDLLFLGTELGLYVSLDAGKNWFQWTHGLPHAISVMDLALQAREHDLVLGTHGRSFMVLDDIRPLRALADLDPATPLQLLSLPPAQQHYVTQSRGPRFPGATEFRGEDDHYGALITWYMNGDALPHPDAKVERERQAAKAKQKKDADAKDADGKVRIEIRNGAGELVRHLEVEGTQGVNRTTWDLNREAFPEPNPEPSPFGPQGGPEVGPGQYTVTLKWGDHTASGTVDVRVDPRIQFDAPAIAARERAIERVGAAQTAITATARQISALKEDLARVKTLAQRNIDRREEADPTLEVGDEDPYKALIKAIGESTKALAESERTLLEPPDTKGIVARDSAQRQVDIAYWFNSGDLAAPTPAQLGYLALAELNIEKAITAANSAIDEHYRKISEQAQTLALNVIATVVTTPYQAPGEARQYFAAD